MEIKDVQNKITENIITLSQELGELKSLYPSAVKTALTYFVPDYRSKDDVVPSMRAITNKILAEVILSDDLNEQKVLRDVEKKKQKKQ